MSKPAASKNIGEIFREGTLIDEAISRAGREAVEMHRRLGHHIVIWKDGKVVRVPPEAIPPAESCEVATPET